MAGRVLLVEEPFQAWDFAEDGGLVQDVSDLLLNNAAQHEGLSILGGEVGAEVARVENGAVQDGHAGNNDRGFGVDFELDVAGVVDVDPKPPLPAVPCPSRS